MWNNSPFLPVAVIKGFSHPICLAMGQRMVRYFTGEVIPCYDYNEYLVLENKARQYQGEVGFL